MKPFKLFITLSFFILYFSSFAQIKKFSEDKLLFIQELNTIFEKSKDEEIESFLTQTAFAWDSLLTDQEKEKIISTSNKLLGRKARINPHVINYIKTYLLFRDHIKAKESLAQWEEGLLYMIKKRKVSLSKIKNYFVVTTNLLKSNTIYKSSTVRWTSSNDHFRFVFDKSIKIIFNLTDLTCYALRDSINIFKTTGEYYPIENLWKGSEGLVTWERAGYNRSNVKAELHDYQIEMKRYLYSADSVTFINTTYFNEPISGKLEDKVKIVSTPKKATYPRFESYIKRFKIKDLYENINYEGGFSMRGAKVIGTGNERENVYLYFFRENNIFLKATSEFFVFSKEKIIGANTAVVFYIESDSIFHPGITMTYIVDKKELSLTPSKGILSRSPYYNTYHNISMSIEQLTWKTNDTIIDISKIMGSAIGKGIFESMNYYNLQDFEKLQRMDDIHPLIAVRNFSKRIKSEEFFAGDYAQYMRKSVSEIRQLLMELAFNGFVFYDLTTDMIKINQRLYDYLNARFGEIDYDVMKFISVVEATTDNGTLNLNNFDLKINGVPNIFLSDSQSVAIYPRNGQITMKKNRDFDFDGVINAGLFTFYGKEFSFNYDSFRVDMNNIDSLKIRVQTEEYDMYGYLLKQVNSTIELITGDLLIDKPNNKSGLEDYPEYPIFNSRQNSFVYYENIHNGVYNRDSFYFEIYPYTIDSLDNFDARNLEFEGKFNSAGIFPVFEEKLTLQEDYSLGFKRDVPSEGYPVYEGKGRFKKAIHLSNQGLHGTGELKYLTSTTYSDDFLFYPNQMKTKAQRFTIESRSTGIQYPSVSGRNDNVSWLPYEDEMYASSIDTTFVMMDDEAKLAGKLTLKPVGLTGDGHMILEKAKISSNYFSYNYKDFKSDTADFKLRTTERDEYTFATDNLNTFVDLNGRKGTFKANDYYSQVEFKENQYIGFIDNFIWLIDEDKLEMSAQNVGLALEQPLSKFEQDTMISELIDGAKYVSVHPAQDRLSFVAPTATYNFRDNFINGHGVKIIHVADAYIYPGDGEVVVEKQAKMRTLVKAKILTNTLTKYHTIFNAQVNIHGRYDYVAAGDYVYLDENYRAQKIHFTHVSVDTSIQSIAKGEIVEPDNFKLSPHFKYIGKTYLEANKKFLTFKGGVQLVHNCDTFGTGSHWLSFETEINPLDIYIPLPEKPKNINNNKTYVGTFLTNDSIHMYSSFLGRRKTYSDNHLVNANGFLYYDSNSGKYKIGSKEKMLDQSIPGNFMSLHSDFCLLHSEGRINLGVDFGQIKIKPVGSVNHDLIKDEIKINIMLPIDFFFSKEAINVFAMDIKSNQHLKSIKYDSKGVIKKLDELIGAKERQKFLSQFGEDVIEVKFPKELVHTIVFSDLKLKWNSKTRSYRSYGQLGIGSILNIPINKYVDGYLEMTKKRSGNMINMFFKVDDNTWYFFNYFRSVMQTISTNGSYIGFIKALKAKQRKVKVRSGQIPYIYMLSNPGKMNKFISEFISIEEIERAEKLLEDSLLNDTIKTEFIDTLDLNNIEIDSLSKDSMNIDTIK